MSVSYDRLETVFAALPLEEITIQIVNAAAGTYTADLEGGPYNGSGGSATAIRDAVLADIGAGTHPSFTAAALGGDSIKLTATGPAQRIAGSMSWNPGVSAPSSADILMSFDVPSQGPAFEALAPYIEALGLGQPLIERQTVDGLRWVGYGTPKTLRMTFEDALSGPDEAALDSALATFTNEWVDNLLSRLVRRSVELGPGQTLLPANYVIASKGPPDGGAKLVSLDALGAGPGAIHGLRVKSDQPTDTSRVIIRPGKATAKDSALAVSLSANTFADLDDDLDTGVKAADTWYFVYVIADSTGSNPTKGLISLADDINDAGPTMPAGYDLRRRVGVILTDIDIDIVDFCSAGEGDEVTYVWNQDRNSPPFRVLSGGSATTFVTVDISAVVPETATKWRGVALSNFSVDGYLRETNVDDQPYGTFRVDGGDSPPVHMSVCERARSFQYCMVSGSGSLSVYVVGFTEDRKL